MSPATRRGALLTALASTSLLAPRLPAAQRPFPDRPVRLLVGGAGGSVPDLVARPLAERMGAALGQPVVVENRAGAGGIPAIQALLQAPVDGHAIALATMAQLVFNPFLFPRLPYDPVRDLAPIAPVVTGVQMLVAHPSFPSSTLPELVTLARGAAEPPRYAVPALGSPPHIVALALLDALGVRLEVVPFRTGPEALTQVLNGTVPLLVDGVGLLGPHVRAGRLKGLVVTGAARQPGLDVPTAAEAGLPGHEAGNWMGLVAPAATPPAVLDALHDAAARATADAGLIQLFARAGMQAIGGSRADFVASIAEAATAWGGVIRRAGLQLE